MTSEGLHKLLDNLNSKNNTNLIHSMPLTNNVVFAKVWLEKPSLSSRPSNKTGPDHFYFIKDENNAFIGVVFDMNYDLHWYVIPTVGLSALSFLFLVSNSTTRNKKGCRFYPYFIVL